MKYTIENILNRYNAGEKLKYIFFWGHTRNGEEVDKSCFSQWYPAPFTIDGVTYNTSEHWMMAMKAHLFGDSEIFENIIHCSKPGEAKELGRKVKGFDNRIWEENREEIVVKGNFYKFSQNPSLAYFLINTRDRVLVEASHVDSIWGVGLAQGNSRIEDPGNWQGLNLLGFALMEVRDMLNAL